MAESRQKSGHGWLSVAADHTVLNHESTHRSKGTNMTLLTTLPRRWGLIVASLVMALAGLMATPSTAHADADGCTTASGPGYTCINVDGSSTYVNWIQGSRSKPGQWICNYEIKAFGTLSNGNRWSQTKLAGCGWSRVWVDFSPRTRFKANTSLCIATRERGQAWEPYYACIRIEA